MTVLFLFVLFVIGKWNLVETAWHTHPVWFVLGLVFASPAIYPRQLDWKRS